MRSFESSATKRSVLVPKIPTVNSELCKSLVSGKFGHLVGSPGSRLPVAPNRDATTGPSRILAQDSELNWDPD